MSLISNRKGNELHSLAQRLNGAATRAYLFQSKTTDVRDELIACRQELHRIIQDMMGDYYREEAAGAKETTGEEQVGPGVLPTGTGGGLHDEGERQSPPSVPPSHGGSMPRAHPDDNVRRAEEG